MTQTTASVIRFCAFAAIVAVVFAGAIWLFSEDHWIVGIIFTVLGCVLIDYTPRLSPTPDTAGDE